MKYLKLILLIICFTGAAVVCGYTDTKGSAPKKQLGLKERKPEQGKAPGSAGYNALGSRRTANMMGYEDTEVSPVICRNALTFKGKS